MCKETSKLKRPITLKVDNLEICESFDVANNNKVL